MEHGMDVSDIESSSLFIMLICQMNIESIIYCFVLCGMVDHTSLIWNISTWSRTVSHYKPLTYMIVSVSCSVGYNTNHYTKTTLMCCNPIFYYGSHMDHRTILYIRVGLTQACPNQVVRLEKYHCITVVVQISKVCQVYIDTCSHISFHLKTICIC